MDEKEIDKIFNNLNAVHNFYIKHTDITTATGLDYLFNTIQSDLEAIHILLKQQLKNQSFVIARNLIEAFVTFVYLLEHNDQIQQYLDDSQLLIFKNNFMMIKHAQDPVYSGILPFKLHDIILDFEMSFSKLSSNNQQRLLKVIKSDIFKLTEQTQNELDKFFKNFKPTFTKIEDMYKAIAVQNQPIANKLNDLREITYDDYNICSQIVHNIYPIHSYSLYQVLRICTLVSNLSGSTLQQKYRLTLPEDLASLVLENYSIVQKMQPKA